LFALSQHYFLSLIPSIDQMTEHVVGVIGAGFMGSGIAGEFARGGLKVHCFDSNPEMFPKSRAVVKENLQSLKDGGIITEDQLTRSLENIQYHSSIEEVAKACTFIIEAVFEDMNIKKDVFEKLSAHAAPGTILASNTSSLSIAEISQSAKNHPENVIACHFLHPAHLIPCVEITRTPATSQKVIDSTKALIEKIGKSPVLLKKEVPGYLAARLQAALFREALYLVSEGVVSAEDADRACRDGFGRRLTVIGPLQVADMAGLDVYAKTSAVMFPDLSNATTAPKLDELVANGALGAKNLKGFYNWTEESFNQVKNRRENELVRRLKEDSK